MSRRHVGAAVAALVVPLALVANTAWGATPSVPGLPPLPVPGEVPALPIPGAPAIPGVPALPVPGELPALPDPSNPPTLPDPGSVPTDPAALPGFILATILGSLPPGTLPTPLVPAVDGVGGAAVTPGSASASVVDLPGLVTIGKSESSKTGSRVTVLSVGGQELLAREGNATGGSYSGPLAPLGDGIDQVNGALCPAGPASVAPSDTGCIVLLYSTATTNQGTATNKTNSSSFRALSITTPDGAESLTVGSTSATTNVRRVFTSEFCTDVATSFLLSGRGTLAAVILANPGGPLNGVKFSVFKVC